MEKFVSRKLILTLVVVVIVAGSDMLGLNLSDETLSSLTTMVLSFVGAQGLVDVSEAIRSGRKVADAVEDVKEVADESEES
jgi:Na+/H+ antiporter NhaC|tara:strand:+ start:389 stop:631 length:243 start_codon:yes stop_codon:yes gene_type:complete